MRAHMHTHTHTHTHTCAQVISPSSEHLFQALSTQDELAWVHALQNCTAQAIKMSSGRKLSAVKEEKAGGRETEREEIVHDAMNLILAVPGNRTCADCSSSGIFHLSLTHSLSLTD